MSEVQSEQVAESEDTTVDGGPFDAPVDLPGPDVDGPADDDGDESGEAALDEADGEPEPEQGDEQARQHAAMNEEALERLHRQLGNANRAHASKVAKIMGEGAMSLIPCPVCMDFVAGAIYPPEIAPIPPEVQERMKQLLGLNSWEDTPNVEWAQQCPDCKGHGEVKTGSFVTGKETTRCLNCGGDGWKNTLDPSQNVLPLSIAGGETGPAVYGQDASQDPDVQHLREKGYTVIPPMSHAAG